MRRANWVRLGIWSGILLVWIGVGHRRVLEWHDAGSLWTAALAVTPDRPRVLINLARTVETAGDRRRASLLTLRLIYVLCDAPRRLQPFTARPRPPLTEGRGRCDP